jgi:nitroreductase
MTAPLLADELSAPPGFAITALIAVGYPEGPSPAPRRKSLEQIAEFDDHSASDPDRQIKT